ncbi:hypothetical protein [Nostoc flagelliforme]|uniref:hypothetical protein n=1 Tax=Nostoc flagelliforme TaxID=1306274 RepID=UPI001F54B2C6|nr:hypothetical protein [Nostoc flagelliforme]
MKSTLLWFGRWLSSGFSGVMFYLFCLVVYLSIGFIFGVNFPSVIACPDTKSFCYQLRWNKSQVFIKSDYINKSRKTVNGIR